MDFWMWWLAAAVLAAAEAVVPGAVLIWLGAAALVVGVVVLLIPDIDIAVQFLLFAVTSIAAVLGVRLWARRGGEERSGEDHPHLNRRAEQYIGTVHRLETAIVSGHGRARVDDGTWSVSGPDLPAGSEVRVVAVRGAILVVEPERVEPAEPATEGAPERG